MTRNRWLGLVIGALFLLAGAVGLGYFLYTLTPKPSFIASSSAAPETAIVLNPGDDLQAAVDAYPENTYFILNPGLYRLQHVVPKNGTIFDGRNGAVLSGAQLFSDFERDGQYWVLPNQTSEGYRSGSCKENAETCTYPEILYIDDVPLTHVSTLDQVKSGSFFFDYSNDRIYFVDDPSGRKVEVSITPLAFEGTASNVVIRNLTIEKYANHSQTGAVHGVDGTRWVVENCIVRLNHGVGVGVGYQMQVLNSRVIRNGQLGVSGMGNNILVQGNEIAYNNFAQFEPGWEAGATKFVKTDQLVVRGNYVHDNDGPGIWLDIDNINALVEDNLVVNNARMGIFNEISYAVIIRNNTVMLNSTDYMEWVYGAQIQISSSRDAQVYNNRVVVSEQGGHGIYILEQDRGEGAYGPHISINNQIHDNAIAYLGKLGESGSAGIPADGTPGRPANNNHFDRNIYYVTDSSWNHWGWADSSRTWSDFRNEGQEPNGVLTTTFPQDIATVPRWGSEEAPAPSRELLLGSIFSLTLGIGLFALGVAGRKRTSAHKARLEPAVAQVDNEITGVVQ